MLFMVLHGYRKSVMWVVLSRRRKIHDKHQRTQPFYLIESFTWFLGLRSTLNHHGLFGWLHTYRIIRHSELRTRSKFPVEKVTAEFSTDRLLQFEVVKEELRVIEGNQASVKV